MEITHIINGCKKGSLRAQKALFTRYKDLVYTISLKYCKNVNEAEDNVHDVFIVLFDRIKKYEKTGSFEGWIKRITIHKAIDKYKQKKAENLPYVLESDDGPTTIDKEAMNVSLDIILKAIQELPDKYRLVFNLYQMDDYSHKEIAQMLSISEGTSKSNLHRAKHILKEKITACTAITKLNY